LRLLLCTITTRSEGLLRAVCWLVEAIPETAELLSEVTRDCWAGSCASTVE
jgi:hypothetical protein